MTPQVHTKSGSLVEVNQCTLFLHFNVLGSKVTHTKLCIVGERVGARLANNPIINFVFITVNGCIIASKPFNNLFYCLYCYVD